MKLTKIMMIAGLTLVSPVIISQNKPVYLDETKPIEQRVEDALSRMTLSEKIAIIHAQSKFSSPGVARLGIPDLWCTDGPHGIRPEVKWDEWDQAGWSNDSCFAFPALTCLAATWNPKMSYLYGKSIGEEARFRNKNVLLGPGVDTYRTPFGGRNFEYMGEDPYLSSTMVVPYIQGLQSNCVAACVKHYVLNDQEYNRHTTNVIVDDRTLYEIYLPPFKAAVTQGKAWSIMGSYNLYKNQHGCHNEYTLQKILRDEWGFDGAVISDWGGAHDTEQAIHNGLDLEFGTWTDGLSTGTGKSYDSYFMAMPYLKLIQDGKVGTTELDQKVRNVLRLIFRTSMSGNRTIGSMVSKEHCEAGCEIGEEGIVLLKNAGNILPINIDKVKKIAVIGENAIKMMTVGGGSSSLKVKYEISPLKGLENLVGSKAKVVYARGYVGDVSGDYNGVVSGQNLKDNRSADELIAEAVNVARSADYVIFFGGLNKSNHQDCEDSDRESLGLPYNQDRLIEQLAQANKKLVVVNISGNAVSMPWINKVPAVLQGWYIGSEAGNALANVLLGNVNPSGKLPFTFPSKMSDVGAFAMGEYPGNKEDLEKAKTNKDMVVNERYNEGLFVGYRYIDKQHLKPLFPFGHGLSYTTFKYGKLTADKANITLTDSLTFTVPITNVGKRAGAEVVELYISEAKPLMVRPVKELKGFTKVYLQPGETKNAVITIGKDALSYFNDQTHSWVADNGDFSALVGSSSQDIRAAYKFKVKN
jgi:beta-glucosidase